MTSHLGRALPSWFLLTLFSASVTSVLYCLYVHSLSSYPTPLHLNTLQSLERCRVLRRNSGPPPDFYSRSHSDRFVPGTKPTLLKNGTIWTGLHNGQEVLKGDVLLDGGIIKAVGKVDLSQWGFKDQTVDVSDMFGAWVTPGVIDMHSRIGVFPAPLLSGAIDDNSHNGIVQPWLRSLDGPNTHDASYELAVAGGITTSLVLPGSAGAINGQAFPIKLRPTSERSPSSKLVEPIDCINSTGWRHLKQACGENPSRTYSGTRMDTAWAFRAIYDTAKKLKDRQDAFCSAAEAGLWSKLGEFPEDLKYEALVDVLRGKVKVQTHCYEAVDFDALIRLSNEFRFPIAAFHHAHEAYLVPDLLKKAWGPIPPALAIFATSARYKRESYRGSEFASRILNNRGLRVIFKSDHPSMIDARFLVHEAQQGYYYGLPANVSLAAVTTTPAAVMGLDHRIGYIRKGHDADVVIWDSHPLSLGATPMQVYVDGISQLVPTSSLSLKPASFQSPPRTPDFDAETRAAVKYQGLPPLTASHVWPGVIFVNVSGMWKKDDSGSWVKIRFSVDGLPSDSKSVREYKGVVVVDGGRITCAGTDTSCVSAETTKYRIIPLDGGTIAPGLVAFGPLLGLRDISFAPETNDGFVFDPLNQEVPIVAGGDGLIVSAVDGLQFATRNALQAVRSGVTSAIVAPNYSETLAGLSTFFSLGAPHKLANGAVMQGIVALRISLRHSDDISRPSVSTKLAMLKRLLLGGGKGELGYWFGRVAAGEIPLVVDVTSADIIATLIRMKSSVESHTGRRIRLTLVTATEAHLLARELGEAGVGIIVAPSRPYPFVWEQRRILPGPPLSKNMFQALLEHNVTVGLGTNPQWDWASRNTRFEASWVSIDSHGEVSQQQALAFVTTNIEKLMGLNSSYHPDLVAYQGGDWDQMESKVVAIINHAGTVEQF